jgi:hypothetical protein
MGFNVLKVVSIKNSALWNGRQYSLLEIIHRFGGAFGLHIQGRRQRYRFIRNVGDFLSDYKTSHVFFRYYVV